MALKDEKPVDDVVDDDIGNDNDTNDVGVDDKTPTVDDKDDEIDFKAVAQQMAVVITGLHETLKGVQTEINMLKNPARKEDVAVEMPDLEEMSNAELAQFISTNIVSAIQRDLAPLRNDIESVQTNTKTKEIDADIARLVKGDAPDFWEWRAEMQPLVEANPLLTAEQAYVLARRTNPTKARQLDAKSKPKSEPRFFGLTPTSNPNSAAHNKRMNAKDAAHDAWDKVMGSNRQNI